MCPSNEIRRVTLDSRASVAVRTFALALLLKSIQSSKTLEGHARGRARRLVIWQLKHLQMVLLHALLSAFASIPLSALDSTSGSEQSSYAHSRGVMSEQQAATMSHAAGGCACQGARRAVLLGYFPCSFTSPHGGLVLELTTRHQCGSAIPRR